MKALGLGNALVDILIQLDNDDIIDLLNYPKGSMQLIDANDIPRIGKLTESLPAQMVSGGSAANTIHGLACLGTSCGYVGKVGPDELGNFYAKDLQAAKINSVLLPSSTVTGRAYTLISPDTERTFATYLGAAVEMMANELTDTLFEGYSLMHIEGYLVQNTELIEKALMLAKKNGLKVSLDLASFNVVEANLEFLKRAIPEYVDIVFANEEEAKAFTGKNPDMALRDLASLSDIAVVKVGKEGSMIMHAGQVDKIGVIAANPIDTTGAGDQYAAGFLHGFMENRELNICGELGALMAGTVIEDYGARIKTEKWAEVKTKVNVIKQS